MDGSAIAGESALKAVGIQHLFLHGSYVRA
jgi:hypothetical protein